MTYDLSDSINQDIETLLRRLQERRGLKEFFRVGDIVRFPGADWYNRERDYKIEKIYNNGFEVSSGEFLYSHSDADVIRLGMTKKVVEPNG